ncbi:hypothetical protein [Ammoniphilus sp. 3BR4]
MFIGCKEPKKTKFGHGGLTVKLVEYWQLMSREDVKERLKRII